MGPLVPDVIGNELNYIIAIFIGMGFGFVLEQAGFSSSKKLVGLFYGYDFTVLRVFFTAGVTAMMGVLLLGHFGLLDLSIIYINPTFLWSAIVGGLIMGLGFVIGGFCPGTSVCAAAIGKIDGMVFVAGTFLGVFIFAEGYPIFENLYMADAWGNVRIFETLGMSQALFAFLLTSIAITAFWATTFVEKKVNGKMNPEFSPKKLYWALTGLAFIIGLSSFVLPDKKDVLLDATNNEAKMNATSFDWMTADELAFRLLDNDKRIQIFDLRPETEYDTISLPNSVNLKLNNLFAKEINTMLSKRNMISLFVADDELTARKGAYIAEQLGFAGIYILKGGCAGFRHDILQFRETKNPVDKVEQDTYRFRKVAKVKIAELIKEYKAKKTVVKKIKPKRVLGGC